MASKNGLRANTKLVAPRERRIKEGRWKRQSHELVSGLMSFSAFYEKPLETRMEMISVSQGLVHS
jgi:hypothetical protein